MQDNNIINKHVTLKEDINEIKTSINRLKWFVLILIIIGTFILSASVNSIKETSTAQYQMFEQKISKTSMCPI